jgi:uncharacterized membrane protein
LYRSFWVNAAIEQVRLGGPARIELVSADPTGGKLSMNCVQSTEKLSPYAYAMRAVAVIAATVAATVLGLMLSRPEYQNHTFFWRNTVDTHGRLALVVVPMASAGTVALLFAALSVFLARKRLNLAEGLYRLALTVSPVAPIAFAPVLLHWSVWQDHDLTFLLFVLLDSLALGGTLAAAARARLWELTSADAELSNSTGPQPWFARFRPAPITWPLLVAVATVSYIVWFSYYTTIWHLSGRSGWDLSIEDNILWNIVHGGQFFHAAPALGPEGSHFRRHAALIAYFLAPFYAIHQKAEMVLILQSILQGLAAVPLFLFARRRLGGAAGCLIAIVYLFQPALQESNLFEAHYVKFGPLPFFTTLWLLDSGRKRWALLAACLTLSVREDVATWVVLLGAWGVFMDRSRRTSAFMTALACVYVAVVKFVIMPSLAGGQDELAFMYRDLIPEGKSSFAWAVVTVLSNPAYFARSLLEMEKLIYFLQILVPLAFIPLTRKIGWFALIPGMVYSLMETQYHALVDIHFQYSPHFLAFMFPALVFALESPETKGNDATPHITHALSPSFGVLRTYFDAPARLGCYGALVLGTLLCSYQYGPIFQQHTSRGGPIPYKFGWDKEGEQRYHAIEALKAILPPNASVAASAFTVTQISARHNGYSLSISLYDAEWIIAPTNRGEYVGDERSRTIQALRSGQFGVVAVQKPFFLAKRGYATSQNASVLAMIER